MIFSIKIEIRNHFYSLKKSLKRFNFEIKWKKIKKLEYYNYVILVKT